MVLATARREAEEPGRDREMGEGGGKSGREQGVRWLQPTARFNNAFPPTTKYEEEV